MPTELYKMVKMPRVDEPRVEVFKVVSAYMHDWEDCIVYYICVDKHGAKEKILTKDFERVYCGFNNGWFHVYYDDPNKLEEMKRRILL